MCCGAELVVTVLTDIRVARAPEWQSFDFPWRLIDVPGGVTSPDVPGDHHTAHLQLQTQRQ